MVILKGTEEEMNEMREKFKSQNRTYAEFYEPDLDNLWTAITFEPIEENEGDELFFNFKLL